MQFRDKGEIVLKDFDKFYESFFELFKEEVKIYEKLEKEEKLMLFYYAYIDENHLKSLSNEI